jgi:hypothetical protein
MATIYDMFEVGGRPLVGQTITLGGSGGDQFLGNEEQAEVPAGYPPYISNDDTLGADQLTLGGQVHNVNEVYAGRCEINGSNYDYMLLALRDTGTGAVRYFFVPQDSVPDQDFNSVTIIS